MTLRSHLVRQLLRLYPAAWRKEYGEEMQSLLLAQKITVPVVGDVILNAARQNLRHPDPWKVSAVLLICWRSICLAWNPQTPLSPRAWAAFVHVDLWLLSLTSFAAACWTAMRDGSFYPAHRGAWWSVWIGILLPKAVLLQLFSAGLVQRFGTDPDFPPPGIALSFPWRESYIVLLFFTAPAFCGALTGMAVRKSRLRTP